MDIIYGQNRKIRLREFKKKCLNNDLRQKLMPEQIETRWKSIYIFFKFMQYL